MALKIPLGILKLLLLGTLVAFGNFLVEWVMGLMDFELRVKTEPMVHRAIMTAAVAYVLLMAIPFVPGVEIGMALLLMFGPKIAPLVYMATVTALSLAFLAGRLIPEEALVRLLRDLRLRRAGALLDDFKHLEGQERLQALIERAPRRFIPLLLRYRYIALALVVNMPGNIALGGGGGISMLSGLSRLFAPGWFLLTAAIAVAPVPLFLVLFGENLMRWPL